MFDCRGMAFSEAGFQASACDGNVRGFKLHRYRFPVNLSRVRRGEPTKAAKRSRVPSLMNSLWGFQERVN